MKAKLNLSGFGNLRGLSRLLIFLIFPFLVQLSFAQPQLEVAFPSLSFSRPVDLQHAGDGSNRLFVVEQAGRIFVFQNDAGVTTKNVFLDIRSRVNDSGNEEGLLGLAFHPDYENNGFFYVYYSASNPRRSVIASCKVDDSNPNLADPNSELVILEIDQPFSNHNGGQIAFGPDSLLYISVGDGGSANDPQNNGQRRETLLGSILRIKVDNPAEDKNYGIPSDNPFTGNTQGFREEIYAYGLRNVWRFSFDFETGMIWAADVGQDRIEEIDIIEKGKNYGWKIMEGPICRPPTLNCIISGLELPIWEYDHGLGSSVTGGYVYHGAGVPELEDAYIYGDFISGRIWSLRLDGSNPTNSELLNTNLNISSFGVDEQGELYICAFDGKIYRFKPTVTGGDGHGDLPTQFQLSQNYPNPFRQGTQQSTSIRFSLTSPGFTEIKIYNLRGRLVRTLVGSQQSAGSHVVQWDGRNSKSSQSSNGLYFYRLIVDGKTQKTRRMILLN